jgi:hypothetical protein
MFITKKHLSRRTLLRGAGVTLALPFLDSMIPARAAATPQAPRFVGVFSPHGFAPEYSSIAEQGALGDLPLSCSLCSHGGIR